MRLAVLSTRSRLAAKQMHAGLVGCVAVGIGRGVRVEAKDESGRRVADRQPPAARCGVADEPDENTHDWHDHDDPNDTLRRGLERSEQQTFAIDLRTLRPLPGEPSGLSEPELDDGLGVGG